MCASILRKISVSPLIKCYSNIYIFIVDYLGTALKIESQNEAANN